MGHRIIAEFDLDTETSEEALAIITEMLEEHMIWASAIYLKPTEEVQS